jgi:hypothetical protein
MSESGKRQIYSSSTATLARKRLDEGHWIYGQMMLGHVPISVSDFYALPDMPNLGRALAVTQTIIDDIEKLTPGAFYRDLTATPIRR